MTHPRRKNLPRLAWRRNFSGWPGLAAALLLALSGCSERLPSSYYRVTAHLMHGEEPVIIDWVVECRHFARSGVMKGYVRETIVPYVIGVRTRDNGMALMVAPAYCGWKRQRTDYLPFLVWGSKAGDFSFFEAYVSPKGFDSPGSQLRIFSIELQPSNQAEYDAWKKTAPKNVVPAKPNPFLEGGEGPRARCLGVAILPIPAALRAAVYQARPADQPEYWIANRELDQSIASPVVGRWESTLDHNPLAEGFGLRLSDEKYPFDVFPEGDRRYFQRHYSGADRQFTSGTDRVALDPTRLGVMSCGAVPFEPRKDAVAFAFPNGTAPLIYADAFDYFGIVRGTDTLFHRRRVEFDIERGDEGDE